MNARATLLLILLVSCAHSLVHVYEISLPSVEQQIARDYYGDDLAAGKQLTGWLSNMWRLMWGVGAVLAGWLVDRVGSRLMLVIYLLGCSLTCLVAAGVVSRQGLFTAMIGMGLAASIYHPAGLALISHETDLGSRPRALGLHGIFGSLGIGLTPLFIGVLLRYQFSWHQVYGCLAIPGVMLAAVFLKQLIQRGRSVSPSANGKQVTAAESPAWIAYFVLTTLAATQGFIYSALMSFLPRYLTRGDAGWSLAPSQGNYLASGVLLLGCFGQHFAGKWARPGQMERQLTLVTFANAPLLAWMSLASGWSRPVSAGLLALVHFMHQPLYNSLIADYTPRQRRSLAYGFSFAMGLGLGSFGAAFAGHSNSDLFVYGSLAGVALTGGAIGLILCALKKSKVES